MNNFSKLLFWYRGFFKDNFPLLISTVLTRCVLICMCIFRKISKKEGPWELGQSLIISSINTITLSFAST